MHIHKGDTKILITLEFSKEFEIPAFLQEDAPIIESLLVQTQELWELQKNIKLKGDNDSLKLVYDKKLIEASLQAQKDLAKETDRWLKEKAGLKEEIAGLLLEKNQLASQLDLKNQALAGKLQAALGEISQLQESRIQLEAQVRSGFLGELEALKESHRRELDNLKGIMTDYRSERDSIRAKLDDLISSRNKQSSSSHLGQQGETDFADICAGAGIHVEHTGREAHKGDYIGIISDQKVLMEVKNYSHVIPTKEVTKFKRDMDENKDCVAGIFISLKTGITHIRNALHIEWLHDGRLLLFVSEMDKYETGYLLEIVKRLIEIVTHYKSDDMDSSEDIDLFKERIEKASKRIETVIKKSTDITKSIRLYKKQSSEMFESLEKMMKLLKDDVADVLTGLNGSEVVEEPEVAEPVLPLLQKKSRAKKTT